MCYIKNNIKLCFAIEPMMNCEGIVYFPSEACWKAIEGKFSQQERENIIAFLEQTPWKRKIKIDITDITPKILASEDDVSIIGGLESTQAGRAIEGDNLFDPQSPLTEKQEYELYLSLEREFAKGVEGLVTIHKEELLEHSVFKEIILPLLIKNKRAQLNYVDKTKG